MQPTKIFYNERIIIIIILSLFFFAFFSLILLHTAACVLNQFVLNATIPRIGIIFFFFEFFNLYFFLYSYPCIALHTHRHKTIFFLTRPGTSFCVFLQILHAGCLATQKLQQKNRQKKFNKGYFNESNKYFCFSSSFIFAFFLFFKKFNC